MALSEPAVIRMQRNSALEEQECGNAVIRV